MSCLMASNQTFSRSYVFFFRGVLLVLFCYTGDGVGLGASGRGVVCELSVCMTV